MSPLINSTHNSQSHRGRRSATTPFTDASHLTFAVWVLSSMFHGPIQQVERRAPVAHLIAPALIPPMKNRCPIRKTRTAGTVKSTLAAISGPQATVFSPKNE